MLFLENIQLYLSRAKLRNRLGHAILFVSNDDTFKRALADYFAMMLLCEKSKFADDTIVPCRSCNDCTQILQQRHVNVEHIKPEQSDEIRIDQVRTLREHLRLSSFNDKARLVVLSNASVLTTQAANALLKSIEEPSPNQYFLLLATSSTAFPRTIASRCQRLIAPSPRIDARSESDPDDDLSQFAGSLLARIRNGDLASRAGLIDEITKNSCDKTQLLLELQKALHRELAQNTELSNRNQRDYLRKPLEAIQLSRDFLDNNVNLQLTLETLLLNSWPIDKK